MEKVTEEKTALQWHPAFFAGLQIELAIEYKSPEDYLSIDAFYKVYGYACFYKADTACINEIKAKEITISYVSKSYPYKLVKHLEREMHLKVQRIEKGIYYVYGMCFPIQLIVTSRLSEKENLWLHSLTDDLKNQEQAERLLKEYHAHRDENLYQSMMNIIIKANKTVFKEEENMCEAIMEIAREKMQEEFEAIEAAGEARGEARGEIKGQQKALISLVRDGLLNAKEAAKRLSISEEEVLEKINTL